MRLLWQGMNVVGYRQLFDLHSDVVEAKRDGQSQGAADSYAMQCIDSGIGTHFIYVRKGVPENLVPPAPEPRVFGPGDLERLGG
ncbi:uncharacterized protein Bfra_004083 [Botrytis fragariae]|uniref:Uncharacterized protein n=1 Tax=Botrytis fragariae TaxID=1964551 RepID=A0A8H6AUQ9_9HELO|nr:uncharacterized protein Bfra_004083 [Botrytis fragariae]KAF5874076.1 hypothetical protein Bfra_004083 [Botrytis fragariae]